MSYTITINIGGDTATAVSLRSLKLDGAEVTQSPALPQAFTDAGGGSWTKTVTGTAAGSSYTYLYRITFADATYMELEGAFTVAADASDVEWFYSDLDSLTDYLGTLNTKILSNQGGEDDATTNTARVQRDGKAVDGIINMVLRGGEYVVPITKGGALLNTFDDDFETRALFRMFSNVLTAYALNQHRLLIASNKTEFDAKISDARNDVIALLEKIKTADYQPDADLDEDDTDEPTPAGSFESVPIVRNGCRPSSWGCL